MNISTDRLGYHLLICAAMIGLGFSAPYPAMADDTSDLLAQSTPTGDLATDMEIAQDIISPATDITPSAESKKEEIEEEKEEEKEEQKEQTSHNPDANDLANDSANIGTNAPNTGDDEIVTRSDEAQDLAQEAENAANDPVISPSGNRDNQDSSAKTSNNKRWWGRPY